MLMISEQFKSLSYVIINFEVDMLFFYCFTDQIWLTYPGEDRILEEPPVAKSKNLCQFEGIQLHQRADW
jgi:hypothetical protein